MGYPLLEINYEICLTATTSLHRQVGAVATQWYVLKTVCGHPNGNSCCHNYGLCSELLAVTLRNSCCHNYGMCLELLAVTLRNSCCHNYGLCSELLAVTLRNSCRHNYGLCVYKDISPIPVSLRISHLRHCTCHRQGAWSVAVDKCFT